MKEDEKKKEEEFKNQLSAVNKSVLETNKSVRKTNTTSLAIAGLAALFAILTFFKDCNIKKTTGQIKSDSVISVKGTLIIATPAKDCLMIAADKRTYNQVDGDLDTITKIVKLGRYTAFTAVGRPTILALPNKNILFSARNIVEAYGLHDKDIAGTVLLPLRDKLIDEFKKCLRNLPYKMWPDSGDPPDKTLFEIEFYQYNQHRHEYLLLFLRFHYIKQPDTLVDADIYEVSQRAFARSCIIPFGNLDVFEEIVQGNNAKLNLLRSSKVVQEFILDTLHQPLVDVDKAVNFSKYFITECSSLSQQINQSPNHIGTTMDIATIDPKNGFRWKERDVSYKRKQ